MKVIFDINNQAEAQQAADVTRAIVGVYGPPAAAAASPIAAGSPDAGSKKRRSTKHAASEDIGAARERLKALATEKGVLWLPPLLESLNAKRLSDLTDIQVRELLA
jgi:hypothetical protein